MVSKIRGFHHPPVVGQAKEAKIYGSAGFVKQAKMIFLNG